MEKIEIANLNEMEAFIEDVYEKLSDMNVVKDNESMSYNEHSRRLHLIARMMWEQKEKREE